MRRLMRILLAAAIVAGFGGFASAQNEVNKDRPGSDIAVQDIGNNANLCRQNCDAIAGCRAWTFVKPGVQGPSAKCYLKNAVPAQVNNNCCTSGVKLSGPVPAGAAVGGDRPGSDIVGINLASPNPTLCKNACDGNANCQAWTFVKPGIQGPQARCYLKNPIPAQVANSCCISGVKLPPPPAPIPPGAQANKDRPGNDYSNFNLPAPDAALCQNACNAQAQCRAWTYVKPGVQGPSARCWLKNAVPVAVNNNCCISGVKPGPDFAVPAGASNNRDRPGNDYANFAVADPQICKNACDGQAQCTAWTFVRPGFQGPQARCYLKNPTPAQVNNNCCISGVKAADPVPPGASNNRDRPGNDFQSFVPPSANAIHCKNACDGNVNCLAWTYVRPGFQGPQARCYLKNPVPAQVVNTCCISGVKAAPPPPPPAGPFEVNINRPGGDYADFGGTANSVLLCFGACALQPQCKAWTFVKPGFQGPLARCWLKNVVPPPVPDVCCTSGVKP